MINFIRESKADYRRIAAQKKSPYALPRVTKMVDPAACATIKMTANPAYGTQIDASTKANTDSPYAVTNITTLKA